MKRLAFFILALSLVGCATTPPRNKKNACSILYEKDEWEAPLRRASRKWGIPKHTILAIIYHESKFVSDAQPPRRSFFGVKIFRRISSAYGYSQALEGTWDEYRRNTGNYYASRSDFADSADFIGWYLNRAVKKLRISRRDAYQLYLVYHQGPNGYRKRSYLRKPSIMRYARKVQRTAVKYMGQMRSCS